MRKRPKARPPAPALKAHFDAVERALVAMKDISANAGHSLHIGTPREWLLRNFLAQHLPSTFEVGTGEIISADSKCGDDRNQFDLVIHRRDHPLLSYGGGITAYFIESVAATIEVKSRLTYEEFKNASIAARKVKQLKKALLPGTAYVSADPLPSPVSYLIAYDGPGRFDRVYKWIEKLRKEDGFPKEPLPAEGRQRAKVQWPGVDAVFVLGKGYIYHDSTPFSWVPEEARKKNPYITWLWTRKMDAKPLANESNLLFFFLLLSTMIADPANPRIDVSGYIREVGAPPLNYGV
jgi:hypothetical protein